MEDNHVIPTAREREMLSLFSIGSVRWMLGLMSFNMVLLAITMIVLHVSHVDEKVSEDSEAQMLPVINLLLMLWNLVLLFGGAHGLVGAFYGNVNAAKVCMLCWLIVSVLHAGYLVFARTELALWSIIFQFVIDMASAVFLYYFFYVMRAHEKYMNTVQQEAETHSLMEKGSALAPQVQL